MTPQDQYLDWLLRLDRLRAIVNALWSFHRAPTEDESREALARVHRIAGIQ